MEKTKRIISLTLAGTIVFTGMGITLKTILNKNSEYNGKEITSISQQLDTTQKQYSTTIDISNIEQEHSTIIDNSNTEKETTVTQTTVTEKPSTVIDNTDFVIYTELKEELNEVIKNKNITGDSKKIIFMMFETIYKNYDSFEEIYALNNVSTKEEFIRENIINNLKNNISEFKLINLTEYDGDDFGGYYSPSTQILELGYYGDLENLTPIINGIHEFTHAGQLALFKNPTIDSNLLSIFTEGESLMSEFASSSSFSLKSGMNFETGNINECYAIKGIKSTASEYIIYSKCYGSLCSIVDKQCMDKVKETGNINLVADYITQNYNIDGNQLLREMSNLCTNYFNGDTEKICNSIEKIEQNINYCFLQILNNCDSKEEIINFMNLKRTYDMQFASECLQNYEDKYTFDIAKSSRLDPYNINDVLYNKCIEYNVIPTFSNDSDKNRKVFSSIMGESTDYFSFYSVGEEKSILHQKYSLSDDENILTIYNSLGKPILQFNYLTNEVIREQENIDKSYVNSSAVPIINKEKQRVL